MRRARHKSLKATFYHLLTRVAGDKKSYPFQLHPEACDQLVEMIHHYTRAYGCRLVSWAIMGGHYHLILWMEAYRPLSREELKHRAYLLWGEKAELKTAGWSDEAWERFNRRLFDLSALMQHLNGEFAKWYNRRYDRHGHFWADRFKNLELLDPEALQTCLLYIETNPTRAHLVERPEQWQPCSAWRRFHGQDQDLMPIEEIFAEVATEQAFATYRERLERRCLKDLLKEGPGTWLDQRQRFFIDGIAVGRRENVEPVIQRYREEGIYRRRKHPISQLEGRLSSVREQRSHARR